MHSILAGDFIGRLLSSDRFQSHFVLQVCAVSFALSCHSFAPFSAFLDTAILSYLPVQFSGTIIGTPTRAVSVGRFARKSKRPQDADEPVCGCSRSCASPW